MNLFVHFDSLIELFCSQVSDSDGLIGCRRDQLQQVEVRRVDRVRQGEERRLVPGCLQALQEEVERLEH